MAFVAFKPRAELVANTAGTVAVGIAVDGIRVAAVAAGAGTGALAGIGVEPRKLAANAIERMDSGYHAELLVGIPRFARSTGLGCTNVVLLRR
jgi:hypothetical protein